MTSRLSIRARIALAIFALSTIALVAMSGAVYFAFRRSLESSLEGDLRSRASSNAALVDRTTDPISLAPSADTTRERAKGETIARLYDKQGTLVQDDSPDAGSAAGEAELVRLVISNSEERVQNLTYSEGEQFRVVAAPVIQSGDVKGVLLTGLETAQVDDPLRTLLIVLVVAVSVTSIALGAGSFVIAEQAMQPVASITHTAQVIAEGNLNQRIQGVEARDEIGDLARTFNTMISRVAETVERERTFAANVAHELRTPLTAMEASVDVTLSQPRAPEEYERTLDAVRDQTQRMNRLTRQLLLLSRLDADAFRNSFEDVDLTDVVTAVASAFGESHTAAQVRVSADDHLPMRGDAELLARAMTNLLENAVRHGSAAAVIDIDARRSSDMIRVTVSDDGPGLDPNAAGEMFRRFRRGRGTQPAEGSGLGLAIVDAVARAHGGAVTHILSVEGTVIALSFPVQP